MSRSAPNLNALWGRVLVDELARCGLRHAVISPGSRSTPLVLAFAAHPDVRDHSVIDERSAAFVALGIARAGGGPAAVVTTSGTAAANLLPAVVEADRAGVPLLLLTADRPPELRDAGDSQSADQVKLFGDRARWFHAVAEPAPDDSLLAYLRSTACEAWARAMGVGGPPGPVHLDLPFRKPLGPAADDGAVAGMDPESLGVAGRSGGAPWRRASAGRPAAGAAVVEELALALAGAERPMVLAGALPLSEAGGADLRAALARLLAVLPVPVWAEAGSQLRLGPYPGGPPPAAVVGTADLLLGSDAFRRFAQPDLVLRLGEAPLAWPLRRFDADLAAAGVRQVGVDPWARRRDPEHGVERTIAACPAGLLAAVAERLEGDPLPVAADAGWLASHQAADRAAREALERAVEGVGELCDGGVVHRLGRHLPEDAALVVSSSMPLREMEAFLPSTDRPVDVIANRGVNGIDGVTSTALGVAEARRAGGESRTVLLTGDVAFAHDLSGALAAGRLGSDLVAVLLDNGGGAIFDHLPLSGDDLAFERHFTTPPGVDFGAVARGLGWRHVAPESWEAVEEALETVLAAAGGDPPRREPVLIQVRTDRGRGRELRRRVLEEVAAAVDRASERPRGKAIREAGAPGARPKSPAPPEEAAVPVLLLHGFTGTGTGAGLAGLARPLAAAGHPVLAPDLPGHGTAPVPAGGATFEATVVAAVAELDRRGVARAHWVGYSMGGRVALAAALAHPERVASLTLLSAAAGIADEAERRERRDADEVLAKEIERDGLAAFVDRWMARPLFASQARLGHRHLRRVRAERLAGSARGYAASLRGAGQGAQPSLWGRLGELRVPLLLVAGAEDPRYASLVREMAERVPGARAAVVPGTGHAVHLEAPDQVARLILEHLAV